MRVSRTHFAVNARGLFLPALMLSAASLCSAAAGYDNKTTFPLILTMDAAGMNGDVATAIGNVVGSLAFPEYKGAVVAIAKWTATLKGRDVHVKLTVTNNSITFSPNNVGERLLLTGVKAVTVSTDDVKDIYDIATSQWPGDSAGFKSVALVTKAGTLLFHLDGDSSDWTIEDWSDLVKSPSTALTSESSFHRARADLVSGLAHVCRNAAVHQIKQ